MKGASLPSKTFKEDVMKYFDFQALPVIPKATQTADIAALSAGEYFLFESQEWQKNGIAIDPKAIDVRHKIHYQRKTDPIDSYGITGPACGYVPEYDVLESDIGADQTKTAYRKGITRNDSRDDDSRNTTRGIFNETDWS